MLVDDKEYIWVQKYRPRSIEACVLPAHIKSEFGKYISDGKVPNMLLHSQVYGTGKTTAALALCADIKADVLFINASNERGIDVIRNKITNFVSTH